MAKVIFYPKPMKDDVLYEKEYKKPVTLAKVIEDMGADKVNLCIYINDTLPETIDKDIVLGRKDFVRMHIVALGNDGGEQANKIVGIVVAVASIAAAAFGAPPIALLAIGAAGAVARIGIRALATRPGVDTSEQTDRAQSPTYSLGASGNAFRPNAPLMVPMGNHRYFPDFSAQPYFRFDLRQQLETISNVFDWNLKTDTHLLNQANWIPITINVEGVNYSARGEVVGSVTPTYTTDISTNHKWYWLIDNAAGSTVTKGEAQAITPDLSTSGIDQDTVRPLWVYINDPAAPIFAQNKYQKIYRLEEEGWNVGGYENGPGSVFVNSEQYEYEAEASYSFFRRDKMLKQIMNFGYGDLTITQKRIGFTDITDFREVTLYQSVKGTTNWEMPVANAETAFPDGIPSDKEYNTIEGNVDSVEGGVLVNNTEISYPNNFITRKGPNNTYAIEIDVEGRLFSQDTKNTPGGYSVIARKIQIEYREVGTTAWQTFDNNTISNAIGSFYEIKSLDYEYPYRETFVKDNLTPAEYEVRVAKFDPDEVQPENVCTINVLDVRFFQVETGENFIGQNREGLQIEASNQLNGRLDRYSAYVQAKCWRNDGSGNFTWGLTSNPADWYLYFARGGFENNSANGSLAYPYSPTIGWVNSADHPDNKEHLWGCGIKEDRIDFDSITNWWNFCNTNNIKFDAVLDDSQNRLEVLERIASIGRGSVTWCSGKLGVIYEDPNDPAVAMFGMNNIIRDSFSISYNTQDLPDKIIVQYVDPEDDWRLNSVEALAPNVTNPSNIQTTTMWGITDKEQAQREANLIAARTFYNRRLIRWETDIEGLIVARGDVVYLSHDLAQWSWSGRVCDAVLDGGQVVSIKVDSADLPNDLDHIIVRLPDNTFLELGVTFDGDSINILGGWSEADFAETYGKETNAASQFPGTHEVDFMIIGDVTATPGKKVRIVDMTFDDNRVSIAAIDEELAYYAHEYDGLPNAIPYGALPDYTRIIAKVYNSKVTQLGNGKAKIHFW